jgi:hypothetical protein
VVEHDEFVEFKPIEHLQWQVAAVDTPQNYLPGRDRIINLNSIKPFQHCSQRISFISATSSSQDRYGEVQHAATSCAHAKARTKLWRIAGYLQSDRWERTSIQRKSQQSGTSY